MDDLKKKKIAVIGSKGLPSHTSGLEIYIQGLTVELADEFEFVVYCRKQYCDKIVKNYKGIKVVHIPSINTKHLDAISYTYIATIVALFMKCDIFWYQALGPAVTMPLVRIFGKRIVSTVHGLDWKREKFGKIASSVLKFGEKCIVENADEIITLNRFDCQYFIEKWGRKTHIISNGVSDARYSDAKIITDKYGLSKNGYILFMSRIVPEKGVHTLIEAYKKAGIKMKLVIAGKGVHTDDYVNKVKRLAINYSNIIFVGAVDGKIKEELYSNACVYVLPSTIEGQSIGLLEAMSYRLPCIVSSIPENVDVIGNEGKVFPVGDVEALAECLKSVCSGQASRIDYKNLVCHKWESTVDMTKDVLKSLG